MEIAIINKYQNVVSRGAETYVKELAQRLSKKHNVDVLTKIDFFKKYDVLIPTNGRLQAFLVRIFAWITNSKMIVSGQSGIGLDDRLNLYSMPDAFVALSSTALNWAKRINPFVKSVYIPNGVDLERFKPSKNSRSKMTILSVGAFTEQKRHDLVIKAVSKIKNVNLVIAGGGGDLKDDLVSLAKRKLGEGNFKFIEVKHEDMPEIYKNADVFTLASATSESFGIVLVEAMASGLPIVATNDPIRKEIVGNSGIFVDPTNTEEYANAIEKVLATNWGNKPRKQAEKFSWDKIALQYEELFKTL